MARRTSITQVQAELDDANDYIEELEAKLDRVAGIVSGEDDDETGDEAEDETDDDELD